MYRKTEKKNDLFLRFIWFLCMGILPALCMYARYVPGILGDQNRAGVLVNYLVGAENRAPILCIRGQWLSL